MFYDETQAIRSCVENPTLIFELMKEGHMELVDKILSKKLVAINTTDEMGNDVLMRLLKYRQYDLVLKHMTNKKWDVNHQNIEGDTFAHILVSCKDVTIEIIKKLRKNKQFVPNIQNNLGQTILDKSLDQNYIYTTVKILEDTRFDNIDLVSFRNLYETYIKSKNYGKYGKLTNLEIIIDHLESKSLLPSLKELIEKIVKNLDHIKQELLNDNDRYLDDLVMDACYQGSNI